MLKIRVEVELSEGDNTRAFEFETEDLTHLPGEWSERRVRAVLFEQAVRIADDEKAIWGNVGM